MKRSLAASTDNDLSMPNVFRNYLSGSHMTKLTALHTTIEDGDLSDHNMVEDVVPSDVSANEKTQHLATIRSLQHLVIRWDGKLIMYGFSLRAAPAFVDDGTNKNCELSLCTGH
jgi:hypothetical protein